jgi:hypothetical protein
MATLDVLTEGVLDLPPDERLMIPNSHATAIPAPNIHGARPPDPTPADIHRHPRPEPTD